MQVRCNGTRAHITISTFSDITIIKELDTKECGEAEGLAAGIFSTK
jgi:hypothetical protein